MAYIKEMESFPAGSNPFHHDMFHMGGDPNNFLVMFGGRSVVVGTELADEYLILFHKRTGKRFLITFNELLPREIQRKGVCNKCRMEFGRNVGIGVYHIEQSVNGVEDHEVDPIWDGEGVTTC